MRNVTSYHSMRSVKVCGLHQFKIYKFQKIDGKKNRKVGQTDLQNLQELFQS